MAEISPSPTSRTFRFGSYTLDVRSGELSNGAGHQRLSEQTLNLLIALLERPGDVVSRDELRQRLWAGDTFVDFEHGLNAAVKRLRDVLGDSAGAPRYIETIPKRGYRLIAPGVSAVASGAVAGTAEWAQGRGLLQEPGGDRARQRGAARRRSWLQSGRWRPRAAAVALLLAIAALLAWRLYPRPPTGDVAPMRVVPLTALVGWEASPSFSPDGRDVAFAWNEQADTPTAIYVTGVDAFNVRRLTTERAREWAPAWSHDGQQIAYLRGDSGANLLGGHVHVVRSRGGESLEISDFDAQEPIVWSRDGRYIVARRASWSETAPGASTGLYAIPARGGPAHEITRSRSPRYDTAPAFSPD